MQSCLPHLRGQCLLLLPAVSLGVVFAQRSSLCVVRPPENKHEDQVKSWLQGLGGHRFDLVDGCLRLTVVSRSEPIRDEAFKRQVVGHLFQRGVDRKSVTKVVGELF